MEPAVTWTRARKPEQKAIRRNAILKAARALFAELEYEEISLNAIAREAEISKPNIYRYFATREEIFLAIFEVEQNRFIDALFTRLRNTRVQNPAERISRAWVDAALKHETFLNLLPQLSTSMEKNASVEQLVQFKKQSHEGFTRVVELLMETDPRLSAEQWAHIIQCGIAMMAGLWPFANPAENVVQAFEHPEVKYAPWKFKSTMKQGLSALIRGSLTEMKG